jgi:hypothetical protein
VSNGVSFSLHGGYQCKVEEKRAHPVDGSTGKWLSQLSPVEFGNVGVAAVVDGDGDVSLRKWGVKGGRMASQNRKTSSDGDAHRRDGRGRHFD